MTLTDLRKFATEAELKCIDALEEHGTQRKAAEALGYSQSTVSEAISRTKARAARQGYAPDCDMKHMVPEGFTVSGVSTNYNAEGEVVQQWVKSSQDRQRMAALMDQSVAAMKDELPIYAPSTPVKGTLEDLANLHVVTDYHFGMLAWGEETGADWDLTIAEETLVNWIMSSVKMSPDAHTGILANIGDFLHFDGMFPVTPTHGHILDADSRFQKVVRVAVRALRRCIDLMLNKYAHVHIVMATGNHDISSSIWLREIFSHVYQDDPRVSVDLNPDVYYAFEWGNTSLFFHHGHKRKMANVSDVLVAKYRDLYGRTEHSYCHMGHLHHIDIKENNLMVVEQHRTLAAPDSHASSGGWMSKRSTNTITYHKNFGEVARSTISPEMLEVA